MKYHTEKMLEAIELLDVHFRDGNSNLIMSKNQNIESVETNIYYKSLSHIKDDLILEIWFGPLLSAKDTMWIGFGSYKQDQVSSLVNHVDHPELGFSYIYQEGAMRQDYYADFERFPSALYMKPVHERGNGEWCGIYQIGSINEFLAQIIYYVESVLAIQSYSFDKPLSFAELRDRAYAAAEYSPKRTAGNRTYFQRCLDVKTYVLQRANGSCESCKKKAPFERRDRTPYLEAHHMFRLSDGGADAPDQVAAICPTCHRKIHHGLEGLESNEILKRFVATKEAELNSRPNQSR